MKTTIDKAGRIVIPSAIRERADLTPGAELEVTLDGFAVRIERAVAGPALVKRGNRLVATPTAEHSQRREVNVAKLIEEERERWPF